MSYPGSPPPQGGPYGQGSHDTGRPDQGQYGQPQPGQYGQGQQGQYGHGQYGQGQPGAGQHGQSQFGQSQPGQDQAHRPAGPTSQLPPGGFGHPVPGGQPTPSSPRPAADPAARARLLSLVGIGSGVLVLVFSFFPWITPRLSVSNQTRRALDANDRQSLQTAIDKIGSVWASAWDLKYASIAVILALVAALIGAGPYLDRRVRSSGLLALGASTLAIVLGAVQIIHRVGVLGRLVDAINSSVSDTVNSLNGGGDVGSFRLQISWSAWVGVALLLIQFVSFALAWHWRADADGAGTPTSFLHVPNSVGRNPGGQDASERSSGLSSPSPFAAAGTVPVTGDAAPRSTAPSSAESPSYSASPSHSTAPSYSASPSYADPPSYSPAPSHAESSGYAGSSGYGSWSAPSQSDRPTASSPAADAGVGAAPAAPGTSYHPTGDDPADPVRSAPAPTQDLPSVVSGHGTGTSTDWSTPDTAASGFGVSDPSPWSGSPSSDPPSAPSSGWSPPAAYGEPQDTREATAAPSGDRPGGSDAGFAGGLFDQQGTDDDAADPAGQTAVVNRDELARTWGQDDRTPPAGSDRDQPDAGDSDVDESTQRRTPWPGS